MLGVTRASRWLLIRTMAWMSFLVGYAAALSLQSHVSGSSPEAASRSYTTVMVAAVVVGCLVRDVRLLWNQLVRLEVVAGSVLRRVSRVEPVHLTPKEAEVLRLLGEASRIDDASLADDLCLSRATVHSHISSLLRKTSLHDRRDLAAYAQLRRGGGSGSSRGPSRARYE